MDTLFMFPLVINEESSPSEFLITILALETSFIIVNKAMVFELVKVSTSLVTNFTFILVWKMYGIYVPCPV